MPGDVSGTGHSGTLQEVPTAVEENMIQHQGKPMKIRGHQGTLERHHERSAGEVLSKSQYFNLFAFIITLNFRPFLE